MTADCLSSSLSPRWGPAEERGPGAWLSALEPRERNAVFNNKQQTPELFNMYLTRQHRWPSGEDLAPEPGGEGELARSGAARPGSIAAEKWNFWLCEVGKHREDEEEEAERAVCVRIVWQTFHTSDAHAQFPHSCRLASLVGWHQISHFVKDSFTTQTDYIQLCIISLEMKWTEDSATSLWNVFLWWILR